MEQEKYIHINLNSMPRLLNFPYPVQSVGYIQQSEALSSAKLCYTDKIEFCLRLDAEKTAARDEIGGEVHETPYPHLFIKKPGIPFNREIDDGRSAFYLMYSVSLIPRLAALGLPLGRNGSPIWTFSVTTSLAELMDKVKNSLSQSHIPGTADRIDLLCFSILGELAIQRKSTVMKENFHRNKILAAASWLRLHYREDFSFDELFRRNGLSRRTFFRYWKENFTASPRQFLQHLKTDAAQSLLENTDRSVTEIAEELGFKNVSHFIRIFKQEKGETPLVCRNKRKYKAGEKNG